MPRYFKVLSGTKEWGLFNKLWTFQDGWLTIKNKLDDFFGCDIHKNLATNIHELYMKNPPDHLRDQFSKNPDKQGFYRAKSNSSIRKKWLEFVKAHQLEDYNTTRLLWELEISTDDMNAIKAFYPMMDGDYYFELREGKKWTGYSWAVELDEPTFLRLRADWLESNNKQTA
ncbi:hypothetical protein HN020_09300 [Brevibacillus borstelensis]|uniref:hypothetical protein n=1 Tax=Brevibacillus borstelensis TaxID=45462 RepID=UPI00148FD4DB|nr:hypothetical protein [Brevibacillus borstelensis]NOU54943.1 hypothetical protein [Brevibacillus borstelensis]